MELVADFRLQQSEEFLLVLHQYNRHRYITAMAKGHLDASHPHRRRSFGCTSAQKDPRPLPGLAPYLDLPPADSSADACAQGLRCRLLCRKPGSEALAGMLQLSLAEGNLALCINPLQKALAVSSDALFNPADLDQVRSHAKYHWLHSSPFVTLFRHMTTVPPDSSRDKLLFPMKSLMSANQASAQNQMQPVSIQCFTYAAQSNLLPFLIDAIAGFGGWLLDKKATSSTTIELDLEIQFQSVIDLYVALVASGLELTRAGHLGLTSLCSCYRNSSSLSVFGQVLSIRLEVSFLEKVTLPFTWMQRSTPV